MGLEKIIKNEAVRFCAELGIIATFLTVCIETVSHFLEVINSTKFLIGFISSIFIVAMRVCWKIQHPEKDAYGKPRYDHSENKKSLAGRLLILLALMAPLSISAIIYYNHKPINNKIAIITTPFNVQPDQFQIDLNRMLGDSIQAYKLDSINLQLYDRCFHNFVGFNSDSVQNIFANKNCDRGLLIIGAKTFDPASNKGSFNCWIHINKLLNLNRNYNLEDIDTSFHSEVEIRMNRSRFVSFNTPDEQAAHLAKFIMGLLYINLGNLEKAKEVLTEVKQEADKTSYGSKLSASCDEWLGHISVSQNDMSKALEHFLDAAKKDSVNLDLYNNIAGLYYHKKDTVNAYHYFLKAKALDKDFNIPIAKPAEAAKPAPPAPLEKISEIPTDTKTTEEKKREKEKKDELARKAEEKRLADIKRKEDSISEQKRLFDAKKLAETKEIIRKKRVKDSLDALNTSANIPVIYKDQIKYRLVMYNDKINPYYITKDNDLIKVTNTNGNYKLMGTHVKNGLSTSVIKDTKGNVVFELVGKEIYMNKQRVGDLQDYK